MSEVILRNSERQLFKKCQWAWQREYQDRLKSGRGEPTALWFGTGIHEAMEHWYIPGTKRGVDPRETWKKYVDRSQADAKFMAVYKEGAFEESVLARELGEDMLTGYLEHYGPEPHIEVISAEETFQVKVPYKRFTPLGEEDSSAWFVGTFDQVYRDLNTGKIFLKDYKTCAQLGSQSTQYLPLDDQAGSYYAVADHSLRKKGLIGKDEAISGIVYDYLVKSRRDQRPKNAEGFACNKPNKKHYLAALGDEGLDKMKIADLQSLAEERGVPVYGEISANQPKKLLDRVMVKRNPAERRRQINRIQNDLSHMSIVRENLLPASKTTSRDCSFCPFLEICELDEKGQSWDNLKDTVFNTWNPYQSHEEGIANHAL